jgi:hypothetical protein
LAGIALRDAPSSETAAEVYRGRGLLLVGRRGEALKELDLALASAPDSLRPGAFDVRSRGSRRMRAVRVWKWRLKQKMAEGGQSGG